MSKSRLFFNSSALFAGVISSTGAARALLVLAEAGHLDILITEQVIAETENALARKVPNALPDYRQTLRYIGLSIVHDPSLQEIKEHHDMIAHTADVPIVIAAMRVQVDFLVTLNRRHFIDDPQVAIRSGLQIGTPGDAIQWFREHHSQG
jgi:predicted nucleic acid-binding protein